MPARIDHTALENVINAYTVTNRPKWAIFAGNEIVGCYEGNDLYEGENMLREWLSMLEAGQSSTVYTLKLYNDKYESIDRKTPNSFSTTFMLNKTNPTRRLEDGTIIIDTARDNRAVGNMGPGYSVLQQQVKELQDQINKERELRHALELKAIEQRFSHQIAGLQMANDKPWWQQITENKDAMSTVTNIFKNVFNPGPKESFIRPQEQRIPVNHAMSGVEKTTTAPVEEPETTDKPGQGIYLQEMLTEAEWNDRERMQIVLDKLRQINDKEAAEGIDPTDRKGADLQSECLASLAVRVGEPVLTLMLLYCQSLNDDDLDGMIKHMMK